MLGFFGLGVLVPSLVLWTMCPCSGGERGSFVCRGRPGSPAGMQTQILLLDPDPGSEYDPDPGSEYNPDPKACVNK